VSIRQPQDDSVMWDTHRRRARLLDLMLEARDYQPGDRDPGRDQVDDHVLLLQHLSKQLGARAQVYPENWTTSRKHPADLAKFEACMQRVVMYAMTMMRLDDRYM